MQTEPTWQVQIAFSEAEDNRTRADAILEFGAQRFHGWGQAKRSPGDQNVPVIGEELQVLAELQDVSLQDVAVCADLDHNVFYAAHTDPQVAEALRGSHWYELREWASRGPGSATGG